MKRFLPFLVLASQLQCFAESKTTRVWGSGSLIYGQATIGGGAMNSHRYTTKVRFVNTKTGVATNWVTKITTNSTTNINKIQMSPPSLPGEYRMEADFNVFCPFGKYTAQEVRSLLFTIGYSIDCLYLIPQTSQVLKGFDGKPAYYYGLYDMVPGCEPACKPWPRSGFTTPYSRGKADANIQMKYWWVKPFWGSTWCLDAYQTSRLPCTNVNCGDFAK
jgi:hypothetical protein